MDIKENIYHALIKCEFPAVKRSRKSNYGDYADLNDIYDAVLPELAKNNIALRQRIVEEEPSKRKLVSRLVHSLSGTEELDERYLIVPPRNDNQSWGIAETYAKKHAIQTLCGVYGENDTDGETDPKKMPKYEPKQEPKKKAPTAKEIIEALQLVIANATNGKELIGMIQTEYTLTDINNIRTWAPDQLVKLLAYTQEHAVYEDQ